MPAKKTDENQTDWLGLDFPVSPIVIPITPQPVAPHEGQPVGMEVSTTPNPGNIKTARAQKPEAAARADSEADKQKSRRTKKTDSGLQRIEAWVPKEVAATIRAASAASGLRMADLIAATLGKKFQGGNK